MPSSSTARLLESGREVEVQTSGKKAETFFHFANIKVSETHDIGDKPDYEAVVAIATGSWTASPRARSTRP